MEKAKTTKNPEFQMKAVSKVVDFATFRKSPDAFTTGKAIPSGDKVKKVSGDKDYKKLIRTDLMNEALKSAGVTEEQIQKVNEFIQSKHPIVGLRERMEARKAEKEVKPEEVPAETK